jgi:hypothetical protein
MKKTVCLLAAACLCGLAAEPKGNTVEMKLEKGKTAAAPDFATALGLDLENIKSLGRRIDRARNDCDPVALAGCARELAAAEEVSGKKASLTSEALRKQAAEMAKYRNRPQELRLVARILGGDVAEALNELADKADKAAETRAKEKSAGKTKGITNVLHVDNHTNYYVMIYVNFEYRGTVVPHGDLFISVGDLPYSTTYLRAHAPAIGQVERTVSYPVDNVTWTLNP